MLRSRTIRALPLMLLAVAIPVTAVALSVFAVNNTNGQTVGKPGVPNTAAPTPVPGNPAANQPPPKGPGGPGVPGNPFADDAASKTAPGTAKPDAGKPAPADDKTTFPAKDLSFVKNIAPILVAKCSRCHIDQTKGKFSMATFDSFKKGTPDGPVFTAGKSADSKLVDVLTSGDMPRAGPKCTKPEIMAIAKWIDEGAKFDGPDDKALLAKLTSATPAPLFVKQKSDEPKLTVVQATGRETIQFSKDIAPVLVENCFGCHTGPNPTGNFQMDRFNNMLRGGQGGNPWVPEQPADSLIIKKLKGTAGARMPQPKNKPPLPDDVIAKFEKWIAEGARFDGTDPNQTTMRLAALTRAKTVTPEELAADRLVSAKHMWLLADPSDKPTTKQGKNLLLVSNLPDHELQDVAQIADQQATFLGRLFHAPADQPLVRGGVTLFVLPGRYDYSEFGRMVEERAYPKDSRGHAKYDTVDAYAVIIPPVDVADYSLAGIIQQQLASIYLTSLPGNPPDWFAEGSGRVLASRVDAKGTRVRAWNDRLKELATSSKLESFVTHGLPPDDNDVAAYGFMREAMMNPGKYSQLVIALRNGEDFTAAFQRVYGVAPQAAATSWAASMRTAGS